MSEVFTHVLDFDSAQPVLCFYFGEVNALQEKGFYNRFLL